MKSRRPTLQSRTSCATPQSHLLSSGSSENLGADQRSTLTDVVVAASSAYLLPEDSGGVVGEQSAPPTTHATPVVNRGATLTRQLPGGAWEVRWLW